MSAPPDGAFDKLRAQAIAGAGLFYEKGKHPDWPDWSQLTEATRGLWLAAAEALEVAAKAAEEEVP